MWLAAPEKSNGALSKVNNICRCLQIRQLNFMFTENLITNDLVHSKFCGWFVCGFIIVSLVTGKWLLLMKF